MSPIEIAVSPLKAIAMDSAGEFARKIINQYLTKLEAAGWDLNVAFPRPHGRMSREAYRSAAAQHSLATRITIHTKPSRRFNDPNIVARCEASENKFVEDCRRNAGEQFIAYVSKLTNKIGEVTEASLESRSVWAHSILTVTKVDGSKEAWKTQQIINVSKLGTPFNQWPTRKLKGA